MKQDRHPVRRAEAPKPTILSQNKKPESSQNPGKYAGNCHPPGYEPSMELEMLHKQRQKEVVTNGHMIRQQHHQQQQRQPQQQQHYVNTGNRYNLDCQSCLLVQMGEKANYGLPCDTCGNTLPQTAKIMKPWEVEGISTDDKYDIEEYANMMKAFTAAATEGNLEQVEYGLSIGAEINSLGERWTGWTALHHAADAGHGHIVSLLLERGADRDKIVLDYSNYTALHLAVTKRHANVVKILLEAGADTEVFTATGCCGTALHLACSLADPELCSLLLGAGSDPSVVSEEGSTILHYLAISYVPEAADILAELLDKHREKLDINAQDWEGCSALMKAAQANDVRQVELLLQAGADKSLTEENFGKNAFKIAEELAHEACMKLLT